MNDSFIAKLLAMLEGMKKPRRRLNQKRLGHEPTPQRRKKVSMVGATDNHGKGETKVRKKMADRSRRINLKFSKRGKK